MQSPCTKWKFKQRLKYANNLLYVHDNIIPQINYVEMVGSKDTTGTFPVFINIDKKDNPYKNDKDNAYSRFVKVSPKRAIISKAIANPDTRKAINPDYKPGKAEFHSEQLILNQIEKTKLEDDKDAYLLILSTHSPCGICGDSERIEAICNAVKNKKCIYLYGKTWDKHGVDAPATKSEYLEKLEANTKIDVIELPKTRGYIREKEERIEREKLDKNRQKKEAEKCEAV